MTDFAKELRRKQTDTERILWQKLRAKRLRHLKFRRQQPIDHYIVDFYCPEKRLIIEIDGGIHFTPEAQQYDEQRQQYLESQGFTILRYTTAEVYGSLDRILDQVLGI